jgi:aminoglycoside phosphotransferase family enzyme/predicted kinase
MENDQQTVVEFLSRPEAYGEYGLTVERIETHISEIFFIGDRVYKLKRAVQFPYLDFATPEKRRIACEAEVTINRRTAPQLYLGVKPIVRQTDGRLVLDGEGEILDWVVEMEHFDQDCLFDRLALKGSLDRRVMEDLGDVIAAFHDQAEPVLKAGGLAGLAMIVVNNAACFAQFGADVLDAGKVAHLNQDLKRRVNELGPVLDGRKKNGQVRHCHGDLHLRNICLLDGKPSLFDAIEFSRDFSDIDVLYDLAFLLMDLDHRDLRDLANVCFNRYMDLTGEGKALGCMPIFLAVRASIRSHVALAAACNLSDPSGAQALRKEAAQYLDMAVTYLEPHPPRLVAVGGLSGSGKSHAAREIASLIGHAPGARVLRSDVLRKRLMGCHPLERLGLEGYTHEMTLKTFQSLYAEAGKALKAGHSVIADAVFSNNEQRDAIARVAEDIGVPFQGLWLEAPLEVMVQRVTDRTGDASDAKADIVQLQTGYDLGDITWSRIDSSGTRQDSLRAVSAALRI